jgi:hypothetical protein
MTQYYYQRQKKTIKQLWLDEWRKHGGVWTRPQAKAVYDGLCRGNPYYTSIYLTSLLRKHGKYLANTQIEERGHKVQVWALCQV